MQLFARLILVALLAAFAVGTVAQAAGSAGIATEMAAVDVATSDMADCDACGDSGAGGMGLACEFFCGAGSFSAVLAPQTDRFAEATGSSLWPAAAHAPRGVIGTPAKQPPRILV